MNLSSNQDAELNAEYTTDTIVGEFNTTYNAKGEMAATASGCVGYDGVSVGLELQMEPGNEDNLVKEYNAAVNWAVDDDTTYSLKTSRCCDAVTATFWKRYSPTGQIAGRLNYDFLLKKREVEVGTQLEYGSGTISAMLAQNGRASFLYKRALSDTVKGSMATQYNA